MVQEQGTWVLYDLKPRAVERCLLTCEQVLQRQERNGFLQRIVTSDEKRMHDSNPKRKNDGNCLIMLLCHLLSGIFTLQRFCCVFGGTRALLSTMNS